MVEEANAQVAFGSFQRRPLSATHRFLQKGVDECSQGMTGRDRARRHRVNACVQALAQQPVVERLKSQRQQRQGRELDLKLGDMIWGLLRFVAGPR